MYQKKVTSKPRLVDLIISSTVAVPPSITRLILGDVAVGAVFWCWAQ